MEVMCFGKNKQMKGVKNNECISNQLRKFFLEVSADQF